MLDQGWAGVLPSVPLGGGAAVPSWWKHLHSPALGAAWIAQKKSRINNQTGQLVGCSSCSLPFSGPLNTSLCKTNYDELLHSHCVTIQFVQPHHCVFICIYKTITISVTVSLYVLCIPHYTISTKKHVWLICLFRKVFKWWIKSIATKAQTLKGNVLRMVERWWWDYSTRGDWWDEWAAPRLCCAAGLALPSTGTGTSTTRSNQDQPMTPCAPSPALHLLGLNISDEKRDPALTRTLQQHYIT